MADLSERERKKRKTERLAQRLEADQRLADHERQQQEKERRRERRE